MTTVRTKEFLTIIGIAFEAAEDRKDSEECIQLASTLRRTLQEYEDNVERQWKIHTAQETL